MRILLALAHPWPHKEVAAPVGQRRENDLASEEPPMLTVNPPLCNKDHAVPDTHGLVSRKVDSSTDDPLNDDQDSLPSLRAGFASYHCMLSIPAACEQLLERIVIDLCALIPDHGHIYDGVLLRRQNINRDEHRV
jgi:hypothetical protein